MVKQKSLHKAIRDELAPYLAGIRDEVEAGNEKVSRALGELGFSVVINGDKVNIERKAGPEGKQGQKGERGIAGPEGKQGKRGQRGFRGPAGKDGQTPIKGVHYHDGKDGKDGKTIVKEKKLTASEIVNMIDGIITPENIDGFENAVKDIAVSVASMFPAPVMVGSGGGVNVQQVTFLTETPSGLINSSNTTYTVSQNIGTVVAFAINGQFIHPSDYTVSNKTITFTTPLDSSLSGLAFTITYIPK